MLDAATALFAAEGIRAVGIDRILSGAGVAKASLYSAFGSKDALVLAYLRRLDERDRTRWTEAVATVEDPLAKVLTFFDLAIASAPARNYRGCQYVNAATEFPDEELEPVQAHRTWFRHTVSALLREAGLAHPDDAAQRIQLIYDGALAGSKVEHSEEPLRLGRQMAELVIAAGSAATDRDQ
ncbi:TetR/AcrR family transcriptional regulator [Rhodococcus sp. X156]|uniref:TetR/AcrR family transcriptional regulator n=1 Tax=Rhodococcus sp. X156 TaxID=2499145 RepID=UPI001F49D7AC|nr:TetR/AcrR family transcriptional regulator [Rhodococcus sp. X156]